MPKPSLSAGKSKKRKVALKKGNGDRAKPAVRETVDDAAPARQEREDRRAAARRTTPAGKGRSQ